MAKKEKLSLAEKYERSLQKKFVANLKMSNIPVLMELAKDPSVLRHYFERRNDYMKLMGKYYNFFEICFTDAFTEDAAQSVEAATNHASGCYPGLWTARTIANTMERLSYIKTEGDRTYLIINNVGTKDTIDELLEQHYAICYEDYTPEALYQLMLKYIDVTISRILTTCGAACPWALLHSSTEDLYTRYGRELGKSVHDSVTAAFGPDGINIFECKGDKLEDGAVAMNKAFTNPFLSYVGTLTMLSGINLDVVNGLLAHMSNVITYNYKDAETRVMLDANITYTLTFTAGEDDKEPLIAQATFRAKDMYTLGTADEPSAALCKRVGKEVRLFLQAMWKAAMTAYLTYPELFATPVEAKAAEDTSPSESN